MKALRISEPRFPSGVALNYLLKRVLEGIQEYLGDCGSPSHAPSAALSGAPSAMVLAESTDLI